MLLEKPIASTILDSAKLITLTVIVNALSYSIDGRGQLMSEPLMRTMLYGVIAIATYHILIDKALRESGILKGGLVRMI